MNTFVFFYVEFMQTDISPFWQVISIEHPEYRLWEWIYNSKVIQMLVKNILFSAHKVISDS